MGTPPPPDAPDPGVQGALGAASAVAAVALTLAELCGFAIPFPDIPIPKLPAFPPSLAFPPQLSFALAIKCSLSDPVSVEVGGGRQGQTGLERDPDYPDAS